ncbi:MAG: phosphatase PAP2 family protein [Desulfobacterales bacterium]
MWQFLEQIDIEFFYFINQGCRNALFDVIMPVASKFKYFIVPTIACWLFLVIKKNLKTRMIAIMILVMIGIADWTNYRIIKPAFNRPRPYHSISEVRRNVSATWQVTPVLPEKIYGKSFSFPSTHAVNTFAAALFLSYYFRSLIPFLYFIVFMVSLSRIYVGAHFPFDVIAGSLVGTLWAVLFIWINNRAIEWVGQKTFRKKQDDSEPE